MSNTLIRTIFHSLYSWIVVGIIAILTVGCSDDNSDLVVVNPDRLEKDFINITLNCIEGTRATSDYTEEGADSLNENRISTVILCLWPKVEIPLTHQSLMSRYLKKSMR